MNIFAQERALRRFAGLRRVSLFDRLFEMAALRRERLRLEKLDDHLLKDIGVSRSEADREARRSPWDAPAHWRR